MTMRLLYRWALSGLIGASSCLAFSNTIFANSTQLPPDLHHDLPANHGTPNSADHGLTPNALPQRSSLGCLDTPDEDQALQVGIHLMGAPLAYMEGHQPSGILPQLLHHVGNAAGVDLEFKLVPYRRIFTRGKCQTHDLGLIYNISYKEKRDSPLDLSCITQPVINSRLYIYGFRLSTNPHPLLASFSSVPLEEDRYHLPEINDQVLQVVGLTSAEAIFKSLLTGRVDYAVSSELLAHYWQQRLATPPLIAFAPIGYAEGYLCYPKSQPPRDGVLQLKRFMEQLHKDDTSVFIGQLLQHYGLPDALNDRLLPVVLPDS